jgi:hypothetical protein
MKERLAKGKNKVLYDLGAGKDAHELHRSFAKMKVFSKAVYLDKCPVPPPGRVKSMPMQTYWMDLIDGVGNLEDLICDNGNHTPVIFARWFFCHLTDP